jgi:hypothetical protein
MEGRFTYCNTVFLYKSEKDVCLQLPRPAVKQNNVIIMEKIARAV